MVQKRKIFLHSINYFRAFAMISIVLMHCYYRVDISLPEKLYYFFRTLIDGGSHYFVFISGVLFHYLFYSTYTFKSFYKSRLQRIFIPYLVLGTTVVILLVFFFEGPLHHLFFTYEGDSSFLYYGIPFLKYFATGRMLIPYWYIPFIMVFYLFSFTFIYFIRMKIRGQAILICLLLIVSMVIHRAYYQLNVLQNVVYFVPVYFSGIFYSQHRCQINNYFAHSRKYLLLFGLSLIVLFIHSIVLKQLGSSFKHFWEITVPDLMIIAKLLTSFSVVIFLSRYDNLKHRSIFVLDLLARMSFGVFFIHQFFIEIASRYSLIDFIPFSGIIKLFLFTFIVIILSMASAYIVKLVVPRYSKYLIGW